jgi:hypothetical protein
MAITARACRLAVTATAIAAFAWPAAARGDAVTDWNGYANAAIFSTGAPAHSAVLSTAMVQGAVYDAVNAIDGGYQPYLPTPRADPTYSQDAAAATAAFRVVVALVPAQAATLQARYIESMAAISDGPAKTGGIAVGEAAAAAMLAARQNDGRGGPFTFDFGTEPGEWRKSPPLFLVDGAAWVGNVKPFLVPDAAMLRTRGPLPLKSRAYARELNEVKSLGSLTSTTRTADQTTAAIFWQAQPGALYGGVMRSLSARYGLSTADNARLYAMSSLAAADGSIGCWNDKYHWNFWRPIDAIHNADADGNRWTKADPTWKALFDPATATVPGLTTPGFPDHPSGHGCVSAGAVGAIRAFFGKDKIAFDIVSSRFPTQPRHFERFSDAVEEVIEARIWGGIHFRNADVQGAKLGDRVLRWERQHYFRPVRRTCRNPHHRHGV